MDTFYKNLEPISEFKDICRNSLYTDLPDDWFVIVADVKGSTVAIESGKYKEINTVGASTIIAVINVDRSIEIPFVFGGDGATLAIPPTMEVASRKALLGAAELSQKGFDLDLRIGMVRVSELRKNSFSVKIAKVKVSENICQASIYGQGWEEAERLLKDPSTRDRFEIKETNELKPQADFTGFECRWKNIPPRKDHKICILVCVREEHSKEKLYTEISNKIEQIYGSPKDHHPLSEKQMHFDLNPFHRSLEAKVRTDRSFLQRLKYKSHMLLMTIIGIFLMKRNVSTESTNWGNYVSDLVANCDYRKFDGMLKMVLDGSEDQKKSLTTYFEELYKEGQIFYGLHTAKHALMTCLIFSYEKNHAHFIDADNGGYAIAAKALKKQMAALKD